MESRFHARGMTGRLVASKGKQGHESCVVALRSIARVALPSNKSMELTGKSGAPFAKKRAKGAPLFPAAHPGR